MELCAQRGILFCKKRTLSMVNGEKLNMLVYDILQVYFGFPRFSCMRDLQHNFQTGYIFDICFLIYDLY